MLKRFARPAAIAVTAIAVTFAASTMTTSTAEAGHRNAAPIVAGAIVGIAAAAIIANSTRRHHYHSQRYYYGPGYGTYGYNHPGTINQHYYKPRHRPRVVRYRAAPWTRAWYSYCTNRYRSFNPHTGYFLGYDGRYHFCR